MKFRLRNIILGCVLLLCCTIPAKAAAPNDINSHWARDSIGRWLDCGVLTGYTDGSFQPNRSITRGEFATILSKTLGLPEESVNHFSDLQTHWATSAVNRCCEAGLINGYEDGTFRPNQPITRQEAMKLLTLAMNIGVRSDDTKLLQDYMVNRFDDADSIGSWALYYAVSMVKNGAMEGSDGILRPQDPISRAEVAVILDRLIGVYCGSNGSLTVTTSAQQEKGYWGNQIVVHPQTTATIAVTEEGGYTVSCNSDASVQITSVQTILSGDQKQDPVDGVLEFENGELKISLWHQLPIHEAFDYLNKDGSVSSYTLAYTYEPDTMLPMEVQYTDEEGIRLYQALYDSDGHLTGFSRDGNLTCKYFYRDESLVREEYYEPDGITLFRYTDYTYDEAGNRLSETQYVYDEEMGKVLYSYNPDGTLAAWEQYYSGQRSARNEMVYTETGEVLEEIHSYFAGEEESQWIYETDVTTYAFGNPIASIITFYDDTGAVTATNRSQYFYDLDGRLVSWQGIDGEDHSSGSGTYTYNQDGTPSREIHLDGSGFELERIDYEYGEYTVIQRNYYEGILKGEYTHTWDPDTGEDWVSHLEISSWEEEIYSNYARTNREGDVTTLTQHTKTDFREGDSAQQYLNVLLPESWTPITWYFGA